MIRMATCKHCRGGIYRREHGEFKGTWKHDTNGDEYCPRTTVAEPEE
jgi:hypothetical protein